MAYGIGLLITFSVLWSTGAGQPALLYLSPICLTAIFVVGRTEIKEMWNDSRTLRLADKLMRKCEKNWSRQRMQRLIAKKRKERAIGGNAGPGVPPEQNLMDRTGGRSKSDAAAGRGRGRGNQGGRGGRKPRNQASRGGRGDRSGHSNPKAGRVSGRGRKPRPEGNDRAAPESQVDDIELEKDDICVDDDGYPGNEALRHAAQNSLDAFGDGEFGPGAYKNIKKQLKGKRFLIKDGSQLREASKLEIRDSVERAFNEAKDS